LYILKKDDEQFGCRMQKQPQAIFNDFINPHPRTSPEHAAFFLCVMRPDELHPLFVPR